MDEEKWDRLLESIWFAFWAVLITVGVIVVLGFIGILLYRIGWPLVALFALFVAIFLGRYIYLKKRGRSDDW